MVIFFYSFKCFKHIYTHRDFEVLVVTCVQFPDHFQHCSAVILPGVEEMPILGGVDDWLRVTDRVSVLKQ